MCDGDIEEEVYQADNAEWEAEPEDDNQDDGNESAWYEDEVILANFRDARRALDQARTVRGYYPVRNPNLSKGDGKNGYRKGSGSRRARATTATKCVCGVERKATSQGFAHSVPRQAGGMAETEKATTRASLAM